MRTALTLDEGVAARVRDEMARTGTTRKEVVNVCLRRGLEAPREEGLAEPFVVEARPMGVRDGLDLDNTGGLLDLPDGPALADANLLPYACDAQSPRHAPGSTASSMSWRIGRKDRRWWGVGPSLASPSRCAAVP